MAKRLAALLLTAACTTVPPSGEGAVYQFNGDTVTIRGGFDYGSGPAEPTPQMIAQAREVCPAARYLDASPSPTDNYTFLYLFRC